MATNTITHIKLIDIEVTHLVLHSLTPLIQGWQRHGRRLNIEVSVAY